MDALLTSLKHQLADAQEVYNIGSTPPRLYPKRAARVLQLATLLLGTIEAALLQTPLDVSVACPGYAHQPDIVRSVQKLKNNLTALNEVLLYLQRASVFDFYLRKLEAHSQLTQINAALRSGLAGMNVVIDPRESARQDASDKQADEVSFRLLLERTGGSRDALLAECRCISSASEAQALHNAFTQLRAREPNRFRGGGFESTFCRNALTFLCKHVDPSATSPPNFSPPLMPFSFSGGMSLPSRADSQQAMSDPGLRHYAGDSFGTFFSPYRSAAVFDDLRVTEEPGPMPPLLPTQPINVQSAAYVAALQAVPQLSPSATSPVNGKARLPAPRRQGSGSQCVIHFNDILTGEARQYKPFSSWLWEVPSSLPRCEAVDKAQLVPGMLGKVVSEWRGTGPILAQAIVKQRIFPSRLLKLHLGVGHRVYILQIFSIAGTIFAAATTVQSPDRTGSTLAGLIPCSCLSVSGKTPASLPSVVDAPLHETAIPFSGRMRTATDQPSYACAGILNVLALEVWRIDSDALVTHPLFNITNPQKIYEEVATQDKRHKLPVFVFSFRTKRSTGSDPCQLLFNKEEELDNLLASIKKCLPSFQVAWP